MRTRHDDRWFLLGLASFGLGCATGTETASDTGPALQPTRGAESGDDAENATTEATEGTGSRGTDGLGSSGSAPTSAGPTGDGTGDPADDGPPDPTTGGGGVPAICYAYGDLIGSCYGNPMYADDAVAYCVYAFYAFEDAGAAACIAAYDEWLACVTALSCEELMGPDVCQAEGDAAFGMGCPFPP